MVLRMPRATIEVSRYTTFLTKMVLRMARASIEVLRHTTFWLKWY